MGSYPTSDITFLRKNWCQQFSVNIPILLWYHTETETPSQLLTCLLKITINLVDHGFDLKQYFLFKTTEQKNYYSGVTFSVLYISEKNSKNIFFRYVVINRKYCFRSKPWSTKLMAIFNKHIVNREGVSVSVWYHYSRHMSKKLGFIWYFFTSKIFRWSSVT